MSMSKCVVLVPVGGSIEPACEEGLRELERRGYEVRRIRGYSQIDLARSQIATDALAAGFEETMWIDSDVGFHPNDVEKLRAYQVPISCGIYPKKGRQELACHVNPGTTSVSFGQNGRLMELRYAATGFLHVRREVYATMQERLSLPICNRRFGTPVVPFFQPLIIADDLAGRDANEAWYLGEDYSFCERARQVGYKIHADTSIRLKHFGSYAYQWEDAGGTAQRYASYALTLNDSSPLPERIVAGQPPILRDTRWQELARRFPWPSGKPSVPPSRHHGWLCESTKSALGKFCTDATQLAVEIGAWLGLSTRWIAHRAPNAGVISIDTWQGSPEHLANPEWRELLPTLFETWQANCWEGRDRLLPLRMNSVEGLQLIAEAGLAPDVVFIDGDHSYEAVRNDLTTALKLFPQTVVVGDDWNWPDVRRAALDVCNATGRMPQVEGTTFFLS